MKDPVALERTLRQVLTQHYALQDEVNRMKAAGAGAGAGAAKASKGAPPGSGPSDTMLLGLRVAPVDSETLADGAALKWNKAQGNFEFS
jgi:hypothetical protein